MATRAGTLTFVTDEAGSPQVLNLSTTQWWHNQAQPYTAECDAGFTGTPVTVTTPAGTPAYDSSVSQAAANAAALAAATTQAEAALVCTPIAFVLPTINNSVLSFDFQSDGKIIIVGDFTTVGGVAHSGIARLNNNGTLDATFTAQLTTGITLCVLVLPDDSILVGGRFQVANGVARLRLCLFNSAGVLQSFNPSANGDVGSGVRGSGLVFDSVGRILVSGEFTTLFGNAHARIARINANLTEDTGFTATCATGPRSVVEASTGKIYACGQNIISVSAIGYSVRRYNSDGTTDSTIVNTFGAGMINAMLEQSDGKFVLGCDSSISTYPGPVARDNIERALSTGAYDSSFTCAATTSSTITDAAKLADESIIFTGNFTTVNGTARNRMAKVSSSGALDATFNPNSDGTVQRIKFAFGSVWVVGSFVNIGGQARSKMARLDATTGAVI